MEGFLCEEGLRLTGFRELLFLRSTAVFGILATLGKIGVRRFQHGILVAMSELALHGIVTGLSAVVLFQGTLETVLIFPRGRSHLIVLPARGIGEPAKAAYPENPRYAKGLKWRTGLRPS